MYGGRVVQRVWLTGSATAGRGGDGPREVEAAGGGGGAPLPGAAGGAARPAGRQGEGCRRGSHQVSCAFRLPALAAHSHSFAFHGRSHWYSGVAQELGHLLPGMPAATCLGGLIAHRRREVEQACPVQARAQAQEGGGEGEAEGGGAAGEVAADEDAQPGR